MCAFVPPFRILDCRGCVLSLGRETLVMGILNVTPDSFSDGGKFAQVDAAVARAEQMVAEGAAVIDVGGQSTRPGFTEVPAADEIERIVPVIRSLAERIPVPLSVDTYKPAVARAALEAGAHLLNDVYGLQRDSELASIAAEFGVPVVVMHQDPAFKNYSGDLLQRQNEFFSRSISIAHEHGIPSARLVLDPGIGFGKTQAQNLELIGRLSELRSLGLPILLGASRKSVIGNVLNLPAGERLEGTLATTALAAWQGVEMVRVHDVAANMRVVRMVAAIRKSIST
jgi:dihydropteroate synthase